MSFASDTPMKADSGRSRTSRGLYPGVLRDRGSSAAQVSGLLMREATTAATATAAASASTFASSISASASTSASSGFGCASTYSYFYVYIYVYVYDDYDDDDGKHDECDHPDCYDCFFSLFSFSTMMVSCLLKYAGNTDSSTSTETESRAIPAESTQLA